MINLNCTNDRKHNSKSEEHTTCGALLLFIDDLKDGILYPICRICGQKWKISIENGNIIYHKISKSTRFDFDDKLKAEI